MWVDNATTTPVVFYGASPTSLTKTASGTSSTYGLPDLKACMTKDTTAARHVASTPMPNEPGTFIELRCLWCTP